MKRTTSFVLLLTIASFALLLSTCTKPRAYTISGHFYEDCSRQPVANKTFTFYQVGGGGGTVGTATTDANGAFKLTYTSLNGSEVRAGIPLNVGVAQYGEIKVGDYTNVEFVATPTCYLRVSMQVFNNSYTNNDTLFVTDFKQPNIPIKVAGPFTNRLLYTIPNYFITSIEYPTSRFAWYYKINGENFRQQTIYFKACDTNNAIVEIR